MVKKYLIEDAVPNTMVVQAANRYWREFNLRDESDYKLRRTMKDQLFGRILDEFNAASGLVAMACTTVQFGVCRN